MKVIINALLIIVIAHLLLENVDYKVIFGKPKKDRYIIDNIEHDQYISPDLDTATQMSDMNQDNSSRDELLDYISSSLPQGHNTTAVNEPFENPKEVKPVNYFVNDNNTPNFGSNILNLNKFYDTMPMDGKHDLKATPYDNHLEKLKVKNNNESNQIGNKPDSWQYANELPMNGGEMNGISGFDNLESSYALFGNTSSSAGCNFPSVNPNDDIRMGMGTPNASNRADGI